MTAKEFLKKKAKGRIHQGNINEISRLLEEYKKIKFQEYFMMITKIR